MSARVFLTGATGFIGSHAAKALLDAGNEVHALIRPGAATARIADLLSRLHVIDGSMDDLASVSARLDALRPDICVHLAWYAEPGKYLTSTLNMDHLRFTLDLALAMSKAGCRRFVGAGTCLEYDTADGTLNESTRIAPRTLYAATKYAAYSMIRDLTAARGMEFAWMRFFYQFGPFEHPARLVPAVILGLLRGERVAVSSGEQQRDFLHIDDVAGAVAAITTGNVFGAVNIGSGVPVSVRDIVARMRVLMGKTDLIDYGAIPQRTGDPAYIVAGNGKLLSTGWKPRFDLDAGLAETIDWWRSQQYPE